ncbi:MAG TPA: bifunctional precorrin-2 dehydrogenase/sirohydrochlorin ferrochelatase [Desulfobacteraceae bacterium]|nr:bifunctional precorrin-2 dehydrogenase/sirohydrochlorin ferrochelatase [Desulfobacteraceae bacterium]
MRYYPVFLDLNHKRALVVGGGLVAQRKVETLVNYGASISVISRELTGRLEEMAAEGILQYLGPEFRDEYLEGVFLVIAATDDPMLNHQVSQRAQDRGLLINAVDQPEDCNFIVPAIMSRGDLQIAISTSGKARHWREKSGSRWRFNSGRSMKDCFFSWDVSGKKSSRGVCRRKKTNPYSRKLLIRVSWRRSQKKTVRG